MKMAAGLPSISRGGCPVCTVGGATVEVGGMPTALATWVVTPVTASTTEAGAGTRTGAREEPSAGGDVVCPATGILPPEPPEVTSTSTRAITTAATTPTLTRAMTVGE